MGGPLSQMTEAVNKIDNGSNQTNTVNGIGGSGSGLSNSNEFFSNNKVTFYFDLPNKKPKSICKEQMSAKKNSILYTCRSWVHKLLTLLECQQRLTPLAHPQTPEFQR